MSTTKTYLHLGGVVFREEAERLEGRLLGSGGRKFYRPNPKPDSTSPELNGFRDAYPERLDGPHGNQLF